MNDATTEAVTESKTEAANEAKPGDSRRNPQKNTVLFDSGRRRMLAGSVGAVGLLASATSFARAFGAACGTPTPAQTEGPFYPVQDQLDKDNDLTRVKDRPGQRPAGKLIYIVGTVVDQDCRPVEGALVEIWQACASGKYRHPNDPNPAPLDPNFQYWGQCTTDALGRYRFRTILPGAYPAAPGWIRPPHVHFMVSRLGHHELTTQMYFEGNTHNAQDRILNALSPEDRAKVIVPLELPKPPYEPNSRVCPFNLVLRRV